MSAEADVVGTTGVGIRTRTLVGIAIVALAVAGTYYWSTTLGFESTDDAFVEGTLSYLAPEIQGRVVEVTVGTNEHVEAGQLLVRLDDQEAQARVARARADLAAAHNRMASTRAEAEAVDAQAQVAAVARSRSALELERIENLAGRGAASQQQLDSARAEYDADVARVVALRKQAEAERQMLGNDAPVKQAEAALAEATMMLERTRLVAPFEAIVGRKNVDPGDIVRPGQALLALGATAARWIDANFKETQLRGMEVGSEARIEIDAVPDYVFHGHVESISPASGAKYALIPPEPAVGNFTKVVQRVPVRVALDSFEDRDGRHGSMKDGGGPALPIGLSAVVTVDVR